MRDKSILCSACKVIHPCFLSLSLNSKRFGIDYAHGGGGVCLLNWQRPYLMPLLHCVHGASCKNHHCERNGSGYGNDQKAAFHMLFPLYASITTMLFASGSRKSKAASCVENVLRFPFRMVTQPLRTGRIRPTHERLVCCSSRSRRLISTCFIAALPPVQAAPQLEAVLQSRGFRLNARRTPALLLLRKLARLLEFLNLP